MYATMRYINDIIIHCTANSIQDGKSKVHAADIVRYHTNDKGWKRCGYHYIIECDGTIVNTLPLSRPGIHCRGRNAHSIGIAYIGGLNRKGEELDTRTAEQKAALLKLITQLIQLYRCDVHGHRDYAKKSCPCFDAHAEYHRIYKQFVLDIAHG